MTAGVPEIIARIRALNTGGYWHCGMEPHAFEHPITETEMGILLTMAEDYMSLQDDMEGLLKRFRKLCPNDPWLDMHYPEKEDFILI